MAEKRLFRRIIDREANRSLCLLDEVLVPCLTTLGNSKPGGDCGTRYD